ncbi:MAG TPA: hypothetical protein VJP59_08295, partial [Gemmatimonadota bacterium]|nr:hypothetical protein [Gemmatimonadota bacterium]
IEDAPAVSGEATTATGDRRSWIAVRRRVTDTEWRPEEALLEILGPGAKRFRVRAVFPGEVMGEPTPWLEVTLAALVEDAEETSWRGAPFRLASTLSSSPAMSSLHPLARGDPTPGQGGQLSISLMSTTTTIASDFEDPPPLTRLQLSTQTDLRGQGFDQQATADLSGSHDIEDPWHAREESRNWVTRLGATQGGFREEAMLGFAPPSFFDQTQLLTVTGSGGGLQGTFGSPAGRVAYYRSVDLSANGSFSAFEPEVRAAAYEASDAAGRFLFRTMWLDVTDPATEGFSSGGEGRALGVIGAADFGPHLRILGEAAGGDFEPGQGSFETARDGQAFRLSLGGTVGTFGYGLTAGRTGEGFVNPANRGFTPAGISDRTHAELTLQKALGRASLSGAYRHVRGGIAEAAGDPGTTENGATVQLALPIGQRVSVTAGGNVVGQRGDALDDLGLPATDRTQRGLDLGVTERLGPFSLTQALNWQDLDDEIQPLSEQTVTGLNVAASGTLTSFLNLATSVAHTRNKAAPEIGTTRQFLVSLQPALTLARLWLTVTPRTAWTRVRNDLDQSRFRTDQYQLVARWSPPWLGALMNLEVASDWNRSWSHLDPEPPDFDRQTVVTLTLNWRADRVWPAQGPAAATPLQVASAAARP